MSKHSGPGNIVFTRELAGGITRHYRILDPGDHERLARVEFSNTPDLGGWRETPNYDVRTMAHVVIHGTDRPSPGFNMTDWPEAAARIRERLAAVYYTVI